MRPSKKDQLIGQKFKCTCNGNEASVVQRGWTENWEAPIVFLDNKEIWELELFFLNWIAITGN